MESISSPMVTSILHLRHHPLLGCLQRRCWNFWSSLGGDADDVPRGSNVRTIQHLGRHGATETGSRPPSWKGIWGNAVRYERWVAAN